MTGREVEKFRMKILENKEEKKKREGLLQRLFYLAFLIIPILFLTFYPTYSVNFQVSQVEGEGSVRVYRTETMGGYYSTWGYLSLSDTELAFEKYPVSTKNLRIYMNEVTSVSFDGLTISFFGVPVQTLDAEQMYHLLQDEEYCILHLQNGYLFYMRTDDDPYFRLLLPYSVPWYALLIYDVSIVMISYFLAFPFAVGLPYIPRWRTILFLLGTPWLTLFFGEWINNNLYSIKPGYIALNYSVLLSVFLLFFILFPHLWEAGIFGGMLFTIWYISNYFVQEFRGKPLLPQDFLAVNTAASVVSGYDLHLTLPMLLAVLFLIASVYAAKKIEKEEPLPRYRYKAVLILLIPVIGVCAYPAYSNIVINYYDTDMIYTCQQNGTVAFFLKFAQASVIQEPEGYSEQALQNILAEYSEPQSVEGIQPTNILMVMNESFADMRVSGTDYDVDVLPYWDQLTQNYTSGTLYVSVRGGGTCNTEFESLTGNSLVFLPAGSTPFANLINQDIFSLGSYFSGQGYQVASLHLQNPQNWNRKKVYPRLGLEPFFSFADYDTEAMAFLRGSYVSDSENYHYLMDLEEAMRGNARFLFNVTLQNHGGYSKNEELPDRVDLSAYGKYPTAETYLTLIKLSDEALQELIEHYQEIQDPTMIVIYGDHQPSLGEKADSWLFGDDTRQLQKYAVPFCIWTNYATDKLTIDAMSANYLPGLILRLGNFPLPPCLQLAEDVFQEYPVLTQQGIVAKDGTIYNSVNELPDDELLRKYSYVQYNSLFDNKCPALYCTTP